MTHMLPPLPGGISFARAGPALVTESLPCSLSPLHPVLRLIITYNLPLVCCSRGVVWVGSFQGALPAAAAAAAAAAPLGRSCWRSRSKPTSPSFLLHTSLMVMEMMMPSAGSQPAQAGAAAAAAAAAALLASPTPRFSLSFNKTDWFFGAFRTCHGTQEVYPWTQA